ncbi:[FeFe] hydrogenase H-cluster radical SAM maturase HydG [Vallitalea guaymasensis]|uniref:[FeFe] hydrogenase H-cluster radical SAM maturase HydG n=1 Tax=Vallitalea guaymasensis TaxID=1185412 RepID=A0A8J8M9A9_9FIRM|nr:[FeFe] hydrogenase H-cluster radical SAM maturase HydG [Vallitalea guaymasensis]QUH28485.1 [FeFe] hydrogenase H-cluster radical SAM maturase HydG [Vallitalea guaymasensis]
MDTRSWIDQVIKQDQIDKYLINGKDFINENEIHNKLNMNKDCSKEKVRAILDKSLAVERLSFDETATLLNVTDEDMWEEMYEVAAEVKRRVYDNRIVFFAPLYCGNLCVNSCRYCGFRKENAGEERKVLTAEEIRRETDYILSQGHKRVIVVYGEHPKTDAKYIAESMKTVYDVKKKSRSGKNSYIRRINVNAAPMSIEDLKMLKEVGIGTYQVFQETYHKDTYKSAHPKGLKANYRWRLYSLHRAMDAGIDDVAIGALFGLYDWRFEVMGLLYHADDLEKQFGIGPHTISFPRLTPASGSELSIASKYLVNNKDFKKLVTVLRLAVPYTGLIITARENPEVRDEVVKVGCTQLDASTKIGIGAYDKAAHNEKEDKQQFTIGDNRTLDQVVNKLAEMGKITSFCTAGYRCGRTGDKIMNLLETGTEGKFCKLNAVLTFREYLDDYATEETKKIGEELIKKEFEEINNMEFYKNNKLLSVINDYYKRISEGERDLYV